jgi:hypothetical protein
MNEGVKELKEFVEALGFIGGNVHEASKDGVDMSDIKSLIDLGKEYEMIGEGFKGFDKMGAELKDISQAELVELFSAMMEAFNKGKE